MKTHDLADKSVYPNHHVFTVNGNKMNLFSRVPINRGDTIILPKGRLSKIEVIVSTEEPSNYLTDMHPATFENTSFYHLKIS